MYSMLLPQAQTLIKDHHRHGSGVSAALAAAFDRMSSQHNSAQLLA